MAKILSLHKFFSTKLEKVLNFGCKEKDKIGALLMQQDEPELRRLRGNTHTGRPLGSENFVVRLEKILDRVLRPKKAGRKPKKKI